MIADEIETVRGTLGLQEEEFRRLPEAEALQIHKESEAQFVKTPGKRWWWDHFRARPARAAFHDQHAYERITQIVPDARARAYLIPASEAGKNPLVYACTVQAAQRVLGECYAFEYYLVAANWEWLLCENHHGVLMAIGEPAETRLRALAS
jgi:hypothetical protein